MVIGSGLVYGFFSNERRGNAPWGQGRGVGLRKTRSAAYRTIDRAMRDLVEAVPAIGRTVLFAIFAMVAAVIVSAGPAFAAAPAITSLSPASGPQAGGTTVTITRVVEQLRKRGRGALRVVSRRHI
jgi:hypothetical protein